MGWLDHSTNNIILDAVLTDYGRQRLATANSAFKISQYALGDDEVDYRNVKKYGRTVGKEKIEKLTPIFEALTNQSIALKYMLVGRETNASTATISTVYLPVLTTNSSINIIPGSTPNATVTVNLVYNNTSNVPAELQGGSYSIYVPDRFFILTQVSNNTLSSPDTASSLANAGDPNRIARYSLRPPANATSLSFQVSNRSIDNTTLSVYGKNSNTSAKERLISSFITVVNDKLGTTLDIPATYKASLT